MNTHQSCVLCGSPVLLPLHRYERAYLVRCAGCSLVFCHKKPELSELLDNYGQYHRGRVLSPITLARYEELLTQFEDYRQNNRLLDIGCGSGDFIAAAKRRGWETFGTEFTNEAVQVSEGKGGKIYKGGLKDIDVPAGYFDVITSFEVLEHINNPLEEIHLINKYLRGHGILYFTTPNFNSLTRLIKRDGWSVIEYPEHLLYFTPSTIDKLMQQGHLSRLWLKTTGVSAQLFKLSRNEFLAEKTTSQQNTQAFRTVVESNSALRAVKGLVNMLLSWLGRGETIKGLYQKQ